jgi:DNA-binding transcriptional regulator YdaS (Cro superfamily)
MSTQLDFYRARAADARADAEAATLDNVRERCLRAAAAWEDMADRAARTDKMRAKQEADKAAVNAAAAAAAAAAG